MAYASPTLCFLLLPLLSHAYQTCPDQAKYHCPDFDGTSVMFPFTNSSLPDCGYCVLECNHETNTTFECGQQQLSYNTKQIFLHNNTLVLVYPGLHQLITNVCKVHQSDSVVIPAPPLTTFTILNQIVFFRCHLSSGDPPALLNPFSNCGDHMVYGPYAEDQIPKPLPPDCTPIKLPNSTDDSFSIVYQLPDECSLCAYDRSRCLDHTAGKPKCPGKGKNRLGVIIAASLFGAFVLISVLLFLKRRKLKDKFTRKCQSFETFLENYGSFAPKRYTYSDIRKMTNSFKEKLGEGGFGVVYKGKLLDGRLAAIKVLKHSKGNGEDFINEVASISRTNHVNVVTLLGFCCAGQKRALIYEFMANGSLESFINVKANCGQLLPLEKLFHVALGIARGLEYLHQGCKTRILHFDIKPHNILLDEHFCPKISDFGLAKVTQQNKKSQVSMSGIRGTIGYIAPEMFCRNFGDASHKSDVYSYGMMVLEMIGSRKRQHAKAECSSELIFPQWIYEQLEHGDNVEVDGAAQNLNEEEKILKRKMIVVSLWCIQTFPSCRPSMSRVLQMLEGSLELIQIPPIPSLSSPPRPQFDPSGSSIVTLHTESLGTSS